MRLIGLTLAIAAMAVAAPADARTPKPKATFAVTLEGTQTNTWSEDTSDPIDQSCSIAHKGSGSERVTFATPAPLKAKVEQAKYHRKPIPRIRFASGDEAFKVRATVERTSNPQDIDTCTGEVRPPDQPSDCGTRTLDWQVFIAPVYLHREHIWVGDDFRAKDQDDPFQSCRFAGNGFPKMLEFRDVPNSGGRLELIDAPLSTSRLFKRGVKHIEVRGHGSQRDADLEAGVQSLTTLDWHVTLKRLK